MSVVENMKFRSAFPTIITKNCRLLWCQAFTRNKKKHKNTKIKTEVTLTLQKSGTADVFLLACQKVMVAAVLLKSVYLPWAQILVPEKLSTQYNTPYNTVQHSTTHSKAQYNTQYSTQYNKEYSTQYNKEYNTQYDYCIHVWVLNVNVECRVDGLLLCVHSQMWRRPAEKQSSYHPWAEGVPERTREKLPHLQRQDQPHDLHNHLTETQQTS